MKSEVDGGFQSMLFMCWQSLSLSWAWMTHRVQPTYPRLIHVISLSLGMDGHISKQNLRSLCSFWQDLVTIVRKYLSEISPEKRENLWKSVSNTWGLIWKVFSWNVPLMWLPKYFYICIFFKCLALLVHSLIWWLKWLLPWVWKWKLRSKTYCLQFSPPLLTDVWQLC